MFSCCFWWFLLGALVGWLLNWLMCRCMCNRKSKCCDTTANSASNDTTPAALMSQAAPVKEQAPIVAEPVVAAPTMVVKAAPAFVLDSAAAKAAGFKLKSPNDLTVVEGIGPKINELFNQAGVTTFTELAQQTVPQMQKILNDAGPRYKLAKPDTWAQQAALAAENKWSELKALQDKLSGGV